MDPDLQKMEEELKSLTPVGLDEALLNRLTDAAVGTLDQMDPESRATEAAISKCEPAALSEDLTARLEVVVSKVPFPVDEKVVLFPRGSESAEEKPKKVSKMRWYAAAAAVALAGGLSALMVNPQVVETKAASALPVQSVPTMTSPGAFMPAAFDSRVSDTDDLGLVWSQSREPMRVVRVVYRDKVVFMDEKGDRIEREIPRVEYLMVKEKID